MIRLTPKASKNCFGPVEFDHIGRAYLKAHVTTVPENGKANKTLIKNLSKSLGLPLGNISVASGATNRNKQILIEGDSKDLFEKIGLWIKDL
ncbi:MAG: DUF167 family protein [Emcibacter sp.]|nr:DUF167 family protein [Emcibacter sp.]